MWRHEYLLARWTGALSFVVNQFDSLWRQPIDGRWISSRRRRCAQMRQFYDFVLKSRNTGCLCYETLRALLRCGESHKDARVCLTRFIAATVLLHGTVTLCELEKLSDSVLLHDNTIPSHILRVSVRCSSQQWMLIHTRDTIRLHNYLYK